MKAEDFEKIVQDILKDVELKLVQKGREYARDNEDRMINFKWGAAIIGQTPEKVLMGYALKHLVSVIDIINALDEDIVADPEQTREKIGDLIAYLILLEGLLAERRE